MVSTERTLLYFINEIERFWLAIELENSSFTSQNKIFPLSLTWQWNVTFVPSLALKDEGDTKNTIIRRKKGIVAAYLMY